jgi:hypothetical protein
MSKLQQSIQQLEPSTRSRSAVAQIGRQVTIYLLSAFIIVVMVVWFGFLGWGVFAFLQWLFEWFKALSLP